MNVLSLFDGISCGQLSLKRLGIPITNYFASEIDKDAITVANSNFPSTVHLGDVRNVKGADLPKIDLLIGGSPCQGFSFIGKGLNFEDERSKLFFEYVRVLHEVKPKYFFLENVKMNKVSSKVISDILQVEPVLLNSALVSAQNRQRLYWTNIPFTNTKIEDLGITLEDIIDFSYTGYAIPKNWSSRVPTGAPKFVDPYNKSAITSNKSTTLRTNVNNGNMWVKVPDGYRNLSVAECEKLQTVPTGYTDKVSSSKAKKLLGNAWTVDVVSLWFKSLKVDK